MIWALNAFFCVVALMIAPGLLLHRVLREHRNATTEPAARSRLSSVHRFDFAGEGEVERRAA